MEPESERARLQDDYPGWRVWRNGQLVYAWRLRTSPPHRLRDATVAGLRARVEVYVKTLDEGHPMAEALARAEALET